MDIHAIAPVGRPDDILHQRVPEAGLFRALIEVSAVVIEKPWADKARIGDREGGGVHTASGWLHELPIAQFT
jgi:hypothetical protein